MKQKETPSKYNLRQLILTTLEEQGKSRFVGFANELEATLDPIVENAVRKKIAGALKHITRKALVGSSTQKETNSTNLTQQNS